ncbi:MAG: FmdB family zinc ribbon protein [Casimicrobium sp.]
MPIYEYACPDCGHQGEHMQKLADAALSTCPSCGKTNYVKKISAAGFALKGSGWYVTDFRNGSTKSSGDKSTSATESKTADSSSTPQTNGASSNVAGTAPVAAPTPAPAPSTPAAN